MLEIGSVAFFVLQADLVGNKLDGLSFESGERLAFILKEESLLDVGEFVDFSTLLKGFGDLHHGVFAHAIHSDVGMGIH